MELNKKIIFITVGLVAAVVVSAILYQFVFKKEEIEPVSPAITFEQPQEIAPKLLVWEDPAGFSLSYPEGLQVNPHQEDDKNYAHLEFSAADHPGSIIVWMKDTNYKMIAVWAEKESEAVGEQIFDTTLDGHEAKKVMYEDGRVITAALDEEVIVLVELLPGPAYSSYSWQPVHDQIIDSFEFVPLAVAESKPPATTGGGASEIWEEEEVVE